MAINLNTPITTPSKTFNAWWIRNLNINAEPGSGSVRMVLVPYNTETHEIGTEETVVFSDRLFDAVSEVPQMASAMNAIFGAVIPFKTWVE